MSHQEELTMSFSATLSDVRLGLRRLRNTPVFTWTAIVILALGVGANGAMFQLVRGALLAPPPYPEPGDLAIVSLVAHDTNTGEREDYPWSYPKFQTLLDQAGFQGTQVAGFARRTRTALSGEGHSAERLKAEFVSPNYFTILGVPPVLGTGFEPEDERRAQPPQMSAILHYSLFKRRFDANPELLGQAITLDGSQFVVRGVMPEGFRGLTERQTFG